MATEREARVPDDEEPAPVHLAMVCDCGDRKVNADELMAEVYDRLGRGSRNFRARRVTDESFMTDIVLSLQHDLRFVTTGIACDQWFAVKGEVLTEDNWDQDITVQCDRVEYGFAAIWKYLADRAGLAVDPTPAYDRPSE